MKKTEKKLTLGTVTVYDFGEVKLHDYNTGDALADELFALESDEGLVLLESAAFKDNVAEFSNYLKSLQKPLAGQLLSYHPNGYTAYDAPVYATEGALRSWQKGGGVYALTDKFIQGFGADKVAPDLPETANIVKAGDTLTLAGMTFRILETPDVEGNYGVEIPVINAVYRHMMGSDVHNILPAVAYIDAEIASLEECQRKGYALILTSHYAPEGQDAVAKKLDYLKKVKELARTCKAKDEFVAAAREAFPGYQGDGYLEMTAGFLFP